MNATDLARLGTLKETVKVLVLKRGRTRLDGAVASERTVALTIDVMNSQCERLWKLGFQLRDIYNLDERHVRALVRDWHADDLAAKTIQNHLSRLRQVCRWIGKPGLLPRGAGATYFLPEVDPVEFKVSTVAKTSKSWSENGIDVVAKIKEANAIDIRFGAMLLMGFAFGLRRKEQLGINPSQADAQTRLLIRGNISKSGRDRDIPLEHPFQRVVLDHVTRTAGRGRPLGWPRRTYKQNYAHYGYLLRCIGITGRDADCVGHGARAEYAENMALLKGLVPATLGGSSAQMGKAEREAIQRGVSWALGHVRPSITGAYYGSFRRRPVQRDDRQSYLEFEGFVALVTFDPEANRLRAVIVGETEDIEFEAETPLVLRAEFERLVQKILEDQKQETVIGTTDSGAAQR